MPRPNRTDYPGAWHHVMNRGRRREPIFESDEHCRLFLELLGEVSVDGGVEVHAWSLMPNHFHLLLHSREPNLSKVMQRLVGRYTRQVNRRMGWDGPLFRGRFKAQLVGEEDTRYLRYLFAYLHLNPVRAHLVARPDEECWTSHRALLGLESAPEWLSTWMVDQLFDSRESFARFVDDLHTKRERWPDMDMATGWLKRRSPGAAPPEERIPLQDPSDLLARILQLTGVTRTELEASSRGRGANPVRRFAIWMLNQHTSLSQRDIASHTGVSRAQVASTLYALRQRGLPDQFRQWERALDLPTSF